MHMLSPIIPALACNTWPDRVTILRMNGDNKRKQLPHQLLGDRLRRLRESAKQSVAEVSGAVEIDPNQLRMFESGQILPDEEILLLLISYFNLGDEEALKVWQLAKYDKQKLQPQTERQQVLALPEDVRVHYTDMVHVTVNNYGVVMNFMQNNGPTGQAMMVSRVGMSREHAISIINLLQQSLKTIEPKSLPEKSSDSK